MDIQMITDRSFSIYLTGSELTARHIVPGAVSLADAEHLIEGIFGESTGRSKVELFCGRDDLIIFVRRPEAVPEVYVFPASEPLICAACAAPEEPSALWYAEGRYILAVWPLDSPCSVLGEFGDRLEAPPEYLAHLKEHGKELIGQNAIARLKTTFGHN